MDQGAQNIAKTNIFELFQLISFYDSLEFCCYYLFRHKYYIYDTGLIHQNKEEKLTSSDEKKLLEEKVVGVEPSV